MRASDAPCALGSRSPERPATTLRAFDKALAAGTVRAEPQPQRHFQTTVSPPSPKCSLPLSSRSQLGQLRV